MLLAYLQSEKQQQQHSFAGTTHILHVWTG